MPSSAQRRRSVGALLGLGLVMLVGTLAAAVAFGTESVSLAAAIAGPGMDRTIVFDVRLPRVLLAAIAGGGLAVVGGAFQALLRNPLAEPYVLGVSGGAAFGATTVIALGLGAAT